MIYFLIVVLAIALDQATKYFAKLHLDGKAAYEIIPNFFSFDYVENRGAAFGIMQGKHIFFFIVTFIAIAIILYIFITEYKTLMVYEKVFLSFFLAGIIGILLIEPLEDTLLILFRLSLAHTNIHALT